MGSFESDDSLSDSPSRLGCGLQVFIATSVAIVILVYLLMFWIWGVAPLGG